MDLFDDLPEPKQTPGPVSAAAARPKSTKEEEEDGEVERSLKRKREDAECHTDKKEEMEEIKKVCREGFQLFHHNVCLHPFL
ncbi:hypothetical protein PAMP_018101 [Pampus punctatissimus]